LIFHYHYTIYPVNTFAALRLTASGSVFELHFTTV